jgi:hypothetical protein
MAALVVAPRAAWAQKSTFEDLAADAEHVAELGDIVRPYVDHCDDKADEARRVCEGVREFLQGHALDRRLAMDVEGALDVGPYQLKTRSIPVTVRACVTCAAAGIDVDGTKVWLGVPGRTELAKRAVPLAPEEVKPWEEGVRRQLRAEVLFTLAKRPATGVSGAHALGVEVVGWRVYNRCTGEVLWSEPASAGRAPVVNVETCPKTVSPEEAQAKAAAAEPPDTRPAKLGRYEIEQALEPARPKVKACYEQYEVGGRADVLLDIQGNGILQAARLHGAFDGTPTGRCVLKALEGIKFPPSRAAKQTVEIPFYLR